MNQDTAATVYDFPAREYGPQGRWPSPDPAGLAAVDPANPQSWNRYAYVGNNPLARIDPTGLDECNIFNVSYEGSGTPFPCNDASTPTTWQGFPPFIPGSPFGGAPQRIGVPVTITFADGTTYTDTWYGSAGPTGTANVVTYAGTQIGDDLKTIPKWYFNEMYAQRLTITHGLFDPDTEVTQPIGSPVTGVFWTNWGKISYTFDLQNYATMAFPNLDLANQTAGGCATAGKKITQFIAQHPGQPIPPSLTQAMGPSCSGL